MVSLLNNCAHFRNSRWKTTLTANLVIVWDIQFCLCTVQSDVAPIIGSGEAHCAIFGGPHNYAETTATPKAIARLSTSSRIDRLDFGRRRRFGPTNWKTSSNNVESSSVYVGRRRFRFRNLWATRQRRRKMAAALPNPAKIAERSVGRLEASPYPVDMPVERVAKVVGFSAFPSALLHNFEKCTCTNPCLFALLTFVCPRDILHVSAFGSRG